MTRDAALAATLLALGAACIVGALRCLAERLLPSAAIYTVLACALAAGAGKAALDAV